MEYLFRFLKIPSMLIMAIVIYIVSKWFINEVLSMAEVNVSQWDTMSQLIIPLLPSAAVAIIVWGIFVKLTDRNKQKQYYQQGQGQYSQQYRNDD